MTGCGTRRSRIQARIRSKAQCFVSRIASARDDRSPNTIGAAEILLSFWLSVCVGAWRFAHVNLLRGDVALRELLGWRRLPGDDATRSFFGRCDWKAVEAFFPPLTQWLLARMSAQAATLDLDSTVFERFGRQEGAKQGYHPRKPGRLSHHPLLAALAEPMLILHGWLRAGNTTAGRQWREIDAHLAVAKFSEQLLGWSQARRFVVVREQVREGRAAVGRKLLEVPGYTYRIFVTNFTAAPELIWRDYNQRATLDNASTNSKPIWAPTIFAAAASTPPKRRFAPCCCCSTCSRAGRAPPARTNPIAAPPPCAPRCSCAARSRAAPAARPCCI